MPGHVPRRRSVTEAETDNDDEARTQPAPRAEVGHREDRRQHDDGQEGGVDAVHFLPQVHAVTDVRRMTPLPACLGLLTRAFMLVQL